MALIERNIEILTFLRYYLPGYKSGGPIRTLANMVQTLSNELCFYIVTSDRDFGDKNPYKNIEPHRWTSVDKAWVYYVPPSSQNIFHWKRIIKNTPHDVLYFNSLFNLRFTLLPLIAAKLLKASDKPIVVAPRGELFPGALSFKKMIKSLFLVLTRITKLYDKVIWQASSIEEVEVIKKHYGRSVEVCIAPNIADKIAEDIVSVATNETNRQLKLVFLSRIVKKKNLDFALDTLTFVNTKLDFHIYGTIEDKEYWEKCQEKINSLPPHIRTEYKGHLLYEEVIKTLKNYDLFLFPTRSENYGHVIVEALSAGVPVLISDQTPWKDLEKEKVGWTLPLSLGPNGFARIINETAESILKDRHAWRKRCIDYVKRKTQDQSVIQANLDLFRTALKISR
ncbi:MAG: glycosyltransferase [Deltaproteobacteria bacterium]|nr:glycosyltransferase [Deltaproteobacteria bacterium]